MFKFSRFRISWFLFPRFGPWSRKSRKFGPHENFRYTGTMHSTNAANRCWSQLGMLHPTLCLCSCVVEGLPGRLWDRKTWQTKNERWKTPLGIRSCISAARTREIHTSGIHFTCVSTCQLALEPVKLVQLSLVHRPRPTFCLFHYHYAKGEPGNKA